MKHFVLPMILLPSVISGQVLDSVRYPVILSEPQLYRAQVGSSVNMACKVRNLGKNVLLWKQGARVLTAGRLTVRRDHRLQLMNTNLTINQLEKGDAGEYECEVESDREVPVSIRHNLDILYPPTVEANPESRELTVKEGNSVTMSCSAVGNPKPAVSWTKDGQTLEESSASLTVYSVNRFSGGRYTCTADNGIAPAASAVISMNVLYPPVVETRRPRVLGGVGTRVQLTCTVQAEPEPEIKWFKNINQELKLMPGVRSSWSNRTHHVLVIHRMSEVDFGEYICEARNSLGMGKTHLHISGNPEKPIFDTNVEWAGPGAYTVYWRSRTHRPITEHTLYYRELKDEERGDWKRINIEKRFLPRHGKMSFTLTNLRENQTYQVQVDVTNFFGKSELSDVFKFYAHPNEYYTTENTNTIFSSFFKNTAADLFTVRHVVLLMLISNYI